MWGHREVSTFTGYRKLRQSLPSKSYEILSLSIWTLKYSSSSFQFPFFFLAKQCVGVLSAFLVKTQVSPVGF